MTAADLSDNTAVEPNDIAAEQAVLGAMLLAPMALAECLDILQAADFYRPGHQEIFTVLRQMDAGGVPVDALTARERLDKQHVKYGGAAYLHDLIASVPSAANASWYAGTVRDLAARRDLERAGRAIVADACNSGLDAVERAERAGRAVDAATARETGSGSVPIADLLPGFLGQLDNRQPEPAVPTGFADLDRLTAGGLHAAELVIVGARPAVGKSVILTGIAITAALRHNLPVVYWSLEMSREEVTQRIVSNVARVPMHVLRARDLSDSDWDRVSAAYNKLTAAPLYINDDPYAKLHQMRGELRRMRHRGTPAALVVVDYLQLMTGDTKPENRQAEVAGLARGLKLMAKEFSVPVIAASQLNRGPEGRQDRRPMLSDLRESGAVEQDSDMVILLHREDAYEPESPRAGEMDLIVAKHRNGPTATCTVAFQGHYSRAVDMAPDPTRP